MCGLAGIAGRNAIWLESALASMTLAQSHRGPDDEGVVWARSGAGRVGFGHRRLSIQDLSSAGHQPMSHPETQDLLIFNGELYNAPMLSTQLRSEGVQFRGHSDTEVLLHLLRQRGIDGVKQLEGMFAFAWFDRVNNCLFLARDPLGIKPLFTCQTKDQLLFASEIRPLLTSGQVSNTLDDDGLKSLLAYGSVQAPWTLFKSIHAFPAGYWQRIDFDTEGCPITQEPVCHWKFPAPKNTADFREASAAVREQLTQSVKSHLLSDVPVGVFLSSGIDSTLVAGLAARQNTDLRAYTVGFSDAPDESEVTLATETAKDFALPHEIIWLNQREALNAVVPWLDALDQPSMDGLNTFVISKYVRDQGIKVALSGQGGDELFGGYPSFTDVPKLMRWMRSLSWLPSNLRAQLAGPLSLGNSDAFREKLKDILRIGPDVVALALQRRRCFSNAQIQSLLFAGSAHSVSDPFLSSDQFAGLSIDRSDIVHAVSVLESRFYLGNTLLPVGDSTGMAHGLEIRLPMLDRPSLDLALSLPGKVKLPNRVADKALLRAAFPELLRPALLQQSKRGFVIPVRRWMQRELRVVCETALDTLRNHSQFNANAIDKLWAQFQKNPESQMWSRIWLLVALGWYLHKMQAVNRPLSVT
jgi:asparagine synthase (glutamine-hydrolysing)